MGEDLRLDYKSQKNEIDKSDKQSKRTLTTEKHSNKYVDAKIEKINSSIKVKNSFVDLAGVKDNNMFKKKRMGSQRGSISQRSNRSNKGNEKRLKNSFDV